MEFDSCETRLSEVVRLAYWRLVQDMYGLCPEKVGGVDPRPCVSVAVARISHLASRAEVHSHQSRLHVPIGVSSPGRYSTKRSTFRVGFDRLSATTVIRESRLPTVAFASTIVIYTSLPVAQLGHDQ